MNKTDCTTAAQHVKEDGGNCTSTVARRAYEELAYMMAALQHAGALFAAIEKAINDGDKNTPFLLAQVGVETTGFQAERAESECDYFSEVASHD